MSEFMSDMFAPGLVSAIIPVYNRSDTIMKAIDSCLQQTYLNVEVIVVDDGSTDETCRKIEHAISERNDGKLKLFKQANAGPSAARNCGLKESKGEFIQFLDSDDVIVSDKIEKDVAELNGNPELGMVYSKVVYVDKSGAAIGDKVSGSPLVGTEIKNAAARNCWHTIAPLYRRSTCEKIGPWAEDLRGTEDLEYASRLKVSEISIKYCDRVSAFARADNQDKLSLYGDTPSFTRAQELFVDYTWKHASKQNCLSRPVVRDLQMWLMNAAIKHALLKDRSGFERCLEKAIRLGGWKVGLKVRMTLLVSKLLGCRKTALLIRWMNKWKRIVNAT